MALSPFHAYYKARTLTGYASGRLKLVAAYAASNIKIYPYQIAAARFALRSPYLKGVVLCDDGALGKTYEAMLIIAQLWYEQKQKIIIVVPVNLVKQWHDTLNDRFSVPYVVIDTEEAFRQQTEELQHNPFNQEAIVITTYDFAAEKEEYIKEIRWDVAAVDEAQQICSFYTGENKTANSLDRSFGDAFRILMTATPMLKIMDLFGLVKFIDKYELGDEQEFYNRYHQKRQNYHELSRRISKFFFRTLKSQARQYAHFTNRIIATADYELTLPEQQLHDMLERFYTTQGFTYPKSDPFRLATTQLRTLSSSSFAMAQTLRNLLDRMDRNSENPAYQAEVTQIQKIYDFACAIEENAKEQAFLRALDIAFAALKRVGANKKALIFTESLVTQQRLFSILNKGKYKDKVLIYNGSHSRDHRVLEQFRDSAQILIATDNAARGLNLEFCSFLVNYDLPQNAMNVEQRICRLDRSEQTNDIFVLNFLCKTNIADVRTLELYNKRILDFDSIIGLSDDIIGRFGVQVDRDLEAIFATARTKEEIDKQFEHTLHEYRLENSRLVEQSEELLFTSFTKQIADSVTVTPQYMQDKAKEINDDLWEVTKYFFSGRYQFRLDDDTRTVSCAGSPPKVFTGTAMRRNEYSMDMRYQPASGRHTITGTLAKNIFGEMFWVGIPDSGNITLESGAIAENCTIGYYRVRVRPKQSHWGGWYYNVFVGKTASGTILSHEECEQIMALPVVSFTKDGETYGERDGISKPKHRHELDSHISPEEFIRRTVTETESAEKEELERIRAMTADLKAGLERKLDALRSQMRICEQAQEKARTTLEKLEAKKAVAALQKELKQGEQSLFMDSLRLDTECERQIKELLDKAQLSADISRQFVINVRGL